LTTLPTTIISYLIAVASAEKKKNTAGGSDTSGAILPVSATTASPNGDADSHPDDIAKASLAASNGSATHTNGKSGSNGQFRLVRNVFVGTLLLCALIVLLVCGYRKGWFTWCCICFSANQDSGDDESGAKTTKNVNGKEYTAASNEA
jgi:hypothetical protein